MRKIISSIGVVTVSASLAFAGFTSYRDVTARQALPAFSASDDLSSIWADYKAEYIEAGSGRALDKQNKNLTTSEGQSYSMLRAVWQDDRPTFDASWKFARENLDRPKDHLFAWRFGERTNGSYGVLTESGGQNTASDADTDIALALVMAYDRWQVSDYLLAAGPIIKDIWTQEVVQVKGRPMLAANNLEKDSEQIIVNPSYLAPYAYRVFAKVDTEHDWNALVTSSYDLIDQVLEAPLDRATSAGLPPNWIRVDRRTGAFVPLRAKADSGLNTDYGYDALRLPWRLALDHQWNAEPRAAKALKRMRFLEDQWQATGRIAGTYTHDGRQPAPYDTSAMYGGSMGYFTVAAPERAQAYYDQKLAVLINPATRRWRTQLSYYDDNWAWFGMALHQGALTELTESVTS